ncbi:MAG: NUDIX hydrolase [Candidatus Competibacterales bacterium]|nr:NUDIX hydrolase [Candidatus Competibacterales bacterium]
MNLSPEEVRYCCRCATALSMRHVAGRPRPACPACGYIHFNEPKVGVGLLLLDARGRLLLVRRGVPPAEGLWALPAGFVDGGEDPARAAVRETHEETGLKAEVTGLVDVYHNPPARAGATIFILYRGRITGGRLAAADDALEAGFFEPDALPELAFASTRDAVRRLRDGRPAPGR